MEDLLSKVNVEIVGQVIESPVFVNNFNRTKVFRVSIAVKRLSGVVDTFYVNYTNELGVIVKKDDFVRVTGDIRTINKRDSDLVLEGYIFAKNLKVLSEDTSIENYDNDCVIENAYVHSFDELRKSIDDDSRDIATYKIKLDRGHGRYSYFKVTSWDNDARSIGNVKDTIKRVNLKCRLQSYVSKKSGRLYLCLVTYNLDLVE